MVHYTQVSKSKRLLQITCAVIWCLLGAGIIFGFAALKTVWLSEGVYANLCTTEENERGYICSRREIKINFVFTCASVVTNFAGVIVGIILDKYGPRLCGVIGGFLIGAGAMMLAFANTIRLLDLYVVGFMIVAFGGPFIFISSFHLSNAFPAHSGLILSVLTGAFDSSTAVYLVYRLIYDESNGAFHPRAFFLLYMIVPVFIIVVSVALMPKDSYKPGSPISKVLEDGSDSGTESSGDTLGSVDAISAVKADSRNGKASTPSKKKDYHLSDDDIISEQTALLSVDDREIESTDIFEFNAEELRKLRISGVWGALHGKSALQQIRTPWFILLCSFSMIQMIRLNYFVASIRAQYEFIFHSPEIAHNLNRLFDVALPIGGIVTVPIGGILLDNFSTVTTLTLLLLMGTAFGVLGNLAYISAAYANIFIFVIYRSLFYTASSDYSAKVFGFDTFGKVYGLISTISGLLNFSQSAFDHLTHRVLNKDPRPVNIGLLLLSSAIGTYFVVYVSRQSRKLKRSALEFEAERATAIRMPGYSVSEA
ncbi:major facilitator superfamily domain-containing protein [Dipodascopsis uninucleata]